MSSYVVELHAYDLSYGSAYYLSPFVVGKQVDAVWHTSVVVYDTEYSYGKDGVTISNKLEECEKITKIGHTGLPKRTTDMYVDALKKYDFAPEMYELFKNNCHHFSEKLCEYLCNTRIPECYRELPQKILGTDCNAGMRRAAVRGGLFASASSAGSIASCSAGPEFLLGSLLVSGFSSLSKSKSKNAIE